MGACLYLQGALESTRVWVDIFAVSQHPSSDQVDDLSNLKTAINQSQATLVCLDRAGTPLTRVWCLYEFDNTIALKGTDALVLLTPEDFSRRDMAEVREDWAGQGSAGGPQCAGVDKSVVFEFLA